MWLKHALKFGLKRKKKSPQEYGKEEKDLQLLSWSLNENKQQHF
jgi:hypothetical protein